MRSKRLLLKYSGTNGYGDLLSAHGIILFLTFYFYHFYLSCLVAITKTSRIGVEGVDGFVLFLILRNCVSFFPIL